MKTQVIQSTVAQGLLSGFHFILNLLLIRWWAPAQFGLFALIFTAGFALCSIHNALINTPYSVCVPARTEPQLLRQTFAWANILFLLGFGGLIWGLLHLPILTTPLLSSELICLYFVTRINREYLRSRWASELQLMPMLTADAAFVGLSLLGLYGYQSALTISQLLGLLTLTQVLSCSYLLWHEGQLLQRPSFGNMVREYQQVWPQSRWGLVGALSTELQNRGYVIAVSALFGNGAVGLLQAGRVFFGPLNIVASAWTRIAKPTMAKLHSQQQDRAFIRILNQGLMAFFIFNVLFGLLLWGLWPWLQSYLFEQRYLNIGWITAQWGVVNLLFHLRSTASTALQAQHQFKPLALTTVWGTTVAFIILGVVGWLGDQQLAISAVIFGEATALLLVFWLLHPLWREARLKHG
ncbi:MAG: hypothetical protein R3Y10_00925 [Ferrimonas sp.]